MFAMYKVHGSPMSKLSAVMRQLGTSHILLCLMSVPNVATACASAANAICRDIGILQKKSILLNDLLI